MRSRLSTLANPCGFDRRYDPRRAAHMHTGLAMFLTNDQRFEMLSGSPIQGYHHVEERGLTWAMSGLGEVIVNVPAALSSALAPAALGWPIVTKPAVSRINATLIANAVWIMSSPF